MTGAEHYRRAEALAAQVAATGNCDPLILIALADGHARLAHAAALGADVANPLSTYVHDALDQVGPDDYCMCDSDKHAADCPQNTKPPAADTAAAEGQTPTT